MAQDDPLQSIDMTTLLVTGGILLVVCGLLYLYMAATLMVLAWKTNTRGAWMAWIPLANLFLMCDVGRRSYAWILLMLVPFVNIAAFCYVWGGIAAARGSSPWLGILVLVPFINLLLPLYLAAGPTSPRPSGVGPRVCNKCGTQAYPADVFCGNCGAPIANTFLPNTSNPTYVNPAYANPAYAVPAAASPVAAYPSYAAPAVATRSSGVGCWIVGGLLGFMAIGMFACCAVGCYFWFSSTAYAPPVRQSASLPPAMAGTMKLLPRDSVVDGQARPTSVASQSFTQSASGQPARPVAISQNLLPPGVDAQSLPQQSSAITSAIYRTDPQGSPVNIQVLSTPNSPGTAGQLTSQITQATGGTTSPFTVQSPSGATFSGTQIQTPTQYICVMTSPDGGDTIIIYAPDAGGATTAARLAGNVGNSQGVQDPQLEPYVCMLPAYTDNAMTMVDIRSMTGDELIASGDSISSTNPAEQQQMDQLVSQLKQFVPDLVTSATYSDVQGGEWNALVATYATPVQATRVGRMVQWTIGWGATGKLNINGVSAFYLDEPDGRIVIFTKGPYIVLLRAPTSIPLERFIEFGERLQL